MTARTASSSVTPALSSARSSAAPSTSASRRVAIVLAMALGLLVLAVSPARAHPLGNFSVNHHDALVLAPDGLQVRAVVDMAEIPTKQEFSAVDTDGDGVLSAPEVDTTAQQWCPELARSVTTTVDGAGVELAVDGVDLAAGDGAAGLWTLRLTCDLRADVDLSAGATVEFADDYRSERVGWHEITAIGDGLALVDPSVPATSVSDELRAYPDDLLSSPLDVRRGSLRVEPAVAGAAAAGADSAVTSTTAGDPFSRAVAAGEALLESTVGRDRLTPLVGGLALLLAALLGAGHALLPGHGKTVMAAYLAGRRGTRVDALIVGGTVTITHTAGVLLLGLLLTVGGAIAGEVILQRLGLLSGVLIAAIGIGLLRDALRSRRAHAPHAAPAAPLADTATPRADATVATATSPSAHALAAVGATSAAAPSESRRGVVGHGHAHHHADADDHTHAQADGHGHLHCCWSACGRGWIGWLQPAGSANWRRG